MLLDFAPDVVGIASTHGEIVMTHGITRAYRLVAGSTPEETLEAFLTQARVDPRVVGLILSGSQVHEGMPTIHSDYDVHVIVGDDGTDLLKELEGFRSSHLDLAVMPLADFRFCGLPGHPLSWMRYAYVHARVVLDRLDGKIADILDSKRTLAPEEAHSHVDTFLDAYINSVYRSLKSSRDGRDAEAHLDAAESIPYVLEVLFALHQQQVPSVGT
ncbi:hypothetical protein [Streptomyces mexicanus]|uniref:hypothetical protein n=1 Tax=Streptomyces mexicanus TaxID=178566 RepID=UPI002E2B32DF|nr:hypothetical protein [Streptomyces mexicanus]